MHIRPAAPSEGLLLTGIAHRSKAHWGYDDDFIATCREELTISAEFIRTHSVFVLEDESVVGFYSLEPDGRQRVELEHLYVDPRHIGKGLGKRLFERACTTAASEGFRTMLVQSDPHAERFYRKMGARRIGKRPSGSIPGRDLPLLEVDLEPFQSPGRERVSERRPG